MTNEVSSVTEHLERVNATLMGEIPTDRAQIASLRTSLFKLANSADIPLPRREIFNQIGYEINDLAHKYNSSKEIYDHSSFDLKRLRELPETKSAFQAFYLLSFEAEKQATLRKKEIEDRMTTLTNQLEIIKKEMTELTCESSQLSTQLTVLSDQRLKSCAEATSLDNELVGLLSQKVGLKKDLRSGIEGLADANRAWDRLRRMLD
jgi:chromosome segregation ATPase